MFAERLGSLPDQLREFIPSWPASACSEWRSLPPDYRARIINTAAAYEKSWPVITAGDYLEFTRNGNRDRFEALYMERRRMLNAFALAECVLGDKRYIDHMADGAILLCEESGWQLPAHNTYVRDAPCIPLPDPEHPVVDLFAAETAAQLAVLSWLFDEDFNAISPLIVKRIHYELHRRIFQPYLNEHFWWMGNGGEPMNNWTAWCSQNVLLTAFTFPCDHQTRQAVVKKTAASLDAFLKDYGEDGACEEGISYYRHAGLCLFNALNILSQVAPEAFAPLWKEPKIRNIAEFIAFMHVEGDRYFNFADASAKAGRCGVREYLFGKAVSSGLLTDFALSDWKSEAQPDLPEEINLFYRLQTAMTMAEVQKKEAKMPQLPDRYFPSIGLVTARDKRFSLAVKAGDNGDSHNHNDVGSLTLYKNGKPFLIDVGVETYTAKTFSDRRYEIWTMQSAYHNLPNFEGIGQMNGPDYAAGNVKVSLQETRMSIDMELAGAYPANARVRSYRRSILFTKEKKIEIVDFFDGDRPAVLSLMVAIKPLLSPSAITLPDLGLISIENGGNAKLETIAVTDARLLAAWPNEIYRILLPLRGNTLRLSIQ